MHSAVRQDSPATIEALVRLGSQALDTPDRGGETPMRTAAYFGRVSIVEALVRLGSRALDTPDKDGCTPLAVAAEYGNVSVIEAFVRLGSQALDAPDSLGRRPLHRAAGQGRTAVIESLFRLGTQSNDVCDHQGRTPIHWAAEDGHVSTLEALVRLGSKAIDATDKAGQTALGLTIENCHYEAFEALLRLSSKAVDAVTEDGRTALHAIMFGDQFGDKMRHLCVEALVRSSGGRLLEAVDKSGRTPLYFAVQLEPYFPQGELATSQLVKALRALAVDFDIPTDGLTERQIERLAVPVTEDEVKQVRWRVYFAQSLTQRLLRVPFLFDQDPYEFITLVA